MSRRLERVRGWLVDRLHLAPLGRAVEHKVVPVHRYTVFYYLGGMTLFFFLVQVLTGILLMLYYRPSARGLSSRGVNHDHRTLRLAGALIHSWSANL